MYKSNKPCRSKDRTDYLLSTKCVIVLACCHTSSMDACAVTHKHSISDSLRYPFKQFLRRLRQSGGNCLIDI